MKYNQKKYHRRSIRLKEYDYSQPGAYFVTICLHNSECIFGEIINGQMQLNEYGKIVETEWLRSSEIRSEIKLDIYQIMPNHLHAIVIIISVGANGHSPLQMTNSRSSQQKNPNQMRAKSLSSMIVGFKSKTTRKINEIRKTPGAK